MMAKKIGKFIQVGAFARVVNSSLAEYGVKKGDVVYAAGNYTLPMEEVDPYTMRMIFICAKVKDDHVMVDEKAFTIDPKNLKPVSDVLQKRLDAIKEADFEARNPEEVVVNDEESP